MSGQHDATFYVQVEPIWSWHTAPAGDRAVVGAKAVRMSQRRPQHPVGGTVLVKLTIRLPEAAFLPLTPEAIIAVPEDMTVANPVIAVEAGDPA